MPTTRRRNQTEKPGAWWVIETTEACGACGHGFAHRTEYYCVACDGPVCAICVERTDTLEFFCPGCHAQHSSEAEGR